MDVFLQFWDLLLFRAIYINWKRQRKSPSNPQKYIQKLEGIYESTPQALLQLVFCVKTGTFSGNPLVAASLIFSIINLSFRQVTDDAQLVRKDSRKPSFSEDYIFRVLFRVVDVSHRIVILAMVWLALGGFALVFILLVEFSALFILAQRVGKLVFLYSFFLVTL